MKKLILSVCTLMSISLNGQAIQPLHISNVTILPNGCNARTATVTLTAAGGQPAPDGLYTYKLGNVVKTARTATFVNFVGGDFLISDAAKNITIATVDVTPAVTEKISVDLVVLPLADAPGCVTVVVTNPPLDSTVTITRLDAVDEESEIHDEVKEESKKSDEKEEMAEVRDQAVEVGPLVTAIRAAVFAVSPTTEFAVGININGDCNFADFGIQFPIPLGQGNAISAYLLRNYCSCVTAS